MSMTDPIADFSPHPKRQSAGKPAVGMPVRAPSSLAGC
jgi:hypothetical protein